MLYIEKTKVPVSNRRGEGCWICLNSCEDCLEGEIPGISFHTLYVSSP